MSAPDDGCYIIHAGRPTGRSECIKSRKKTEWPGLSAPDDSCYIRHAGRRTGRSELIKLRHRLVYTRRSMAYIYIYIYTYAGRRTGRSEFIKFRQRTERPGLSAPDDSCHIIHAGRRTLRPFRVD